MAELRNIVISTLILSGVFIAFIGFYAQMHTNYDTEPGKYLNDTAPYDKSQETDQMLQEIKDKIYNTSITNSGSVDFSVMAAYSSVRSIFSGTMTTIQYLVYQFQYTLGIPDYVRNIFLSLLLAVIVFAVIGGYLRNKW